MILFLNCKSSTDPEKMLGFLDYLMFLMEYSTKLNVKGMVMLDDLMREDFATNPEWNWSQHRSESHFTIQRVVSEKQFQTNYNTESKQNQQQPGGFKQQNGYSGNNLRPRQNYQGSFSSSYPNQNFSQGQSQGRGGQGQKCRRTDQFSEEVSVGWNVDSCSRGTNCKRQHVCTVCKGQHKQNNCPLLMQARAGPKT